MRFSVFFFGNVVVGLFLMYIYLYPFFSFFSFFRSYILSITSVGLAVGLVASSILFGIITSAVNTVIVCFAASPVDFEKNHPELSQEMRSAWREVWPGCMVINDMRLAVATYLNMGGENLGGEVQPLLA